MPGKRSLYKAGEGAAGKPLAGSSPAGGEAGFSAPPPRTVLGERLALRVLRRWIWERRSADHRRQVGAGKDGGRPGPRSLAGNRSASEETRPAGASASPPPHISRIPHTPPIIGQQPLLGCKPPCTYRGVSATQFNGAVFGAVLGRCLPQSFPVGRGDGQSGEGDLRDSLCCAASDRLCKSGQKR